MSSRCANWILLISGSLCMLSAGAAGQSYMSLVGELVGKVESLRMLRDHCSHVAPETTGANNLAYQAWADRNEDLLALVRTQRESADRRIARQAEANRSAPKSTAEVVALLEQSLAVQLRQSGADSQKHYCAKYPEMISLSEKTRREEISALLKTVAHADKVLSEREKQP